MSKYESLWKYLKENNKEEYKLSYEEIRKILGFGIDHSFLTYKKESKEYGYEIIDNPRECYIDGCWNKEYEKDYLTEIEFPVKKRYL